MSETIRTASFGYHINHGPIGYADNAVDYGIQERRRCEECNCYLRATNPQNICASCERRETAKWMKSQENPIQSRLVAAKSSQPKRRVIPDGCKRCHAPRNVFSKSYCDACLDYFRDKYTKKGHTSGRKPCLRGGAK